MELSSPCPLLRHQEDSSFMAGSVPLAGIIYLAVFAISQWPYLLINILSLFFSAVLIKCSEEEKGKAALSTVL